MSFFDNSDNESTIYGPVGIDLRCNIRGSGFNEYQMKKNFEKYIIKRRKERINKILNGCPHYTH